MRIILATDAWEPQVNGVARTLQSTVRELERLGYPVTVLHPGLFWRFPCPFTHDVELAVGSMRRRIRAIVRPPCAIHISTEGPIGFAVRRLCQAEGWPFTTAYHTNFPDYMRQHAAVPIAWTAAILRWFHKPASAVMVAAPSLAAKLKQWRFHPPTRPWSRGIDRSIFHPREKTLKANRPIALYVGRVAKEKNIEAFLDVGNDVEKYVVGEGPEQKRLQKRYPHVHFTGVLKGAALAQMYSNADVFVFPSLTDTFGLVVIEALACGVPVAAFPVPGPADILGTTPGVGCCHANLEKAIDVALATGSRAACLEMASQYTWEGSTEQFIRNLVPIVAMRAVPILT